ncbi:hypothetical protein ACE6H2_020495 [Prunus campanulata]
MQLNPFWCSESDTTSSHLIMVLPKFWNRSESNRCKKLDNSSSHPVRSLHGVVGFLLSSSYWISLQTHQVTLSTLL